MVQSSGADPQGTRRHLNHPIRMLSTQRTLQWGFTLIATTSPFEPAYAASDETPEPGSHIPSNLEGVWSLSLGFGEIPFLAGSFKPSVGFGYHFNRFFFVGAIAQLGDFLERGDDSFNAVNANVDGLTGTRERTGPRMFLGARIRPHRYSPYLSVGAVFNGTDIERMAFDGRSRTLDEGAFLERFEMEIARPFGVPPAFGLGYAFTFDSGLTLNLEFSGAWLFDPPAPEIRVLGNGVPEGVQQDLIQRFRSAYQDNFHNRYHLFHIGVGYAW